MVGVADVDDEGRVEGASQDAIEFVDLPALPLPSHPEPFARVPLTAPMAQKEPVPPVRRVQSFDPRDRRGENPCVLGLRLHGRVAKVTQDREVDMRIEVAERLHFNVRDQYLERATLSSIVGTMTIVRSDAGASPATRVEAIGAAE